MNILISFIKAIAVFDLLVIAVYFGGDILTTVMDRFRKKPVQDDPFDFPVTDAVTVPLSIDSFVGSIPVMRRTLWKKSSCRDCRADDGGID